MKLPKLFDWGRKPNINNAANEKDEKVRKTKKLSDLTVPQRSYRCELQISELENAIRIAEDPINPRRYALINIMKHVIKDNHLRSQIRTAINEVLEEPIVVYDGKTISEEKTKLLDRSCFTETFRYMLQAEFWGHSLIEFQDLTWDEEAKGYVFDKVKLLPREHVCPEQGIYLLRPTDSKGLPYREKPFNVNLIEAGEHNHLGELMYCAEYSIRKIHGIQDWSRSSEKWGDPILKILTDSDDERELNKKEQFARDFGNNGYMIGDKSDDEIELVERKNADGYKITESLVKYMDQENSKGVNGQVATSDENAYVGSSEVQERVLAGYSSTRLKNLITYINEILIPFLVNYNEGNTVYAALKGCTVGIKPKPEPQQQEDNNNNNDQKKKPQGGVGVKKSPTARYTSVSSHIANLYSNTCDCEQCKTPIPLVSNSIDIDALIAASIRRLYDRKIAAGQPDADIWKYNADNLFNGVIQGTSYNVDKLKYGSIEQRLVLAMRYNTSVTAAFKSHQNAAEMARELFDADGKPRSFYEFNKAVKPIADKYNKQHLLVEFNTAQGRARSAAQEIKWRKKGGKARYFTQKDGRVRDKHKKYEGITLALDHEFWIKHTPPIWGDWGCRCFRRWMPDTEPDFLPTDLPELPTEGATSPFQTMKAFLDDLKYFEVDEDFADLAKDLFHLPMPLTPEQFSSNMRLYDVLINDAQYKLLHTDNLSGGHVFRHINSKVEELEQLSGYGRKMSKEFGDSVVIREYVESAADRQPDFIINREVAELKVNATGKKNTVDFLLRQAGKQASHVIISVPDMDKAVLRKLIIERVKRGSIELLTIVYNGKASRWTRAQILEGYLSL